MRSPPWTIFAVMISVLLPLAKRHSTLRDDRCGSSASQCATLVLIVPTAMDGQAELTWELLDFSC